MGMAGLIEIRDVLEADAAAIASLYGYHVLHGTASYELEPPSVSESLAKIRRITAPGWPFLIAEFDGEVGGYAYATQFRDRPAYRFTCENSIYIRNDVTGRGIGKLLLTALVKRAGAFGFKQMISVVGGAEPASIALHEACGFDQVGRLHKVGWKKKRWLDTVYLQRELAD